VREVAVTVPLARGLEIRSFFFSFLFFSDLKYNHLLSILSPTLCIYRPILTISTTLLHFPAISNDTSSNALQWTRSLHIPTRTQYSASPIPRPILLLIRQLLGLLPFKHDIPPLHPSPLHHLLGTLIPPAAEHVHADRLHGKPIHEPPEIEFLAARPLFGGFVVERAGFGLLEHEDAEAMVGGALLRVGREPGKDYLGGGREAG